VEDIRRGANRISVATHADHQAEQNAEDRTRAHDHDARPGSPAACASPSLHRRRSRLAGQEDVSIRDLCFGCVTTRCMMMNTLGRVHVRTDPGWCCHDRTMVDGPSRAGAWPESGDLDFCYLTTRGRVTGRPHEIEIWFALDDRTLYLLSGGGHRSDWVRNLRVDPSVTVRIGAVSRPARARVLTLGTDEDRRARQLVFAKYQPRSSGSLVDWRERALVVALDVGTRDDGQRAQS
jgi:deazaflavin-dependent oxidoreductase (nitroreductase family)